MNNKKMNPVIHFELPAEDRERMKDFYAQTFGWEFNQLGPEMGHYTVVMTTESDDKGPKKMGVINGGFYQKTDDKMSQNPSVVIAVDNVDEHIKKIKESGGTIHGEPMDIPGVGKYLSFTDTEGNRLSILQPIVL